MRILTAAAGISLLALATLGAVVLIFIPVTAEEALMHSEDIVGEASDEYTWKCPVPNGLYRMEVLVMHIDREDFLSTHDGMLR